MAYTEEENKEHHERFMRHGEQQNKGSDRAFEWFKGLEGTNTQKKRQIKLAMESADIEQVRARRANDDDKEYYWKGYWLRLKSLYKRL